MIKISHYHELRRSEKNPEMADARVRSLKEITAMLDNGEGFTADPISRLDDFLADLTLDTDRTEEKDVPKDSVTLITMHSCKGLEFPHELGEFLAVDAVWCDSHLVIREDW